MAFATLPAWFTAEVASRLSGVTRPDPASVQHYAHCPVPRHPDRHRSFAIRPGDTLPLVYTCHVDCSNEECRAALLDLGVPEENLGPYGTPPFEARRRTQANIADSRRIGELEKQVERLQWEMLELKVSVRSLMHSDIKLALLKIRIWAVLEDADIPSEEKAYVDFAEQAGVPRPTGYRVWKTDPLVLAARAKGVVSTDHVVLTQPEDESQVPQVGGDEGIIKLITAGHVDYRTDSRPAPNDYQNDNAEVGTILQPTKPAA